MRLSSLAILSLGGGKQLQQGVRMVEFAFAQVFKSFSAQNGDLLNHAGQKLVIFVFAEFCLCEETRTLIQREVSKEVGVDRLAEKPVLGRP